MKPIIIIPPDVVSDEGIKALNDNGICTVVATDPSKVQFANPDNSGYFSEVAIRFTRRMLHRDTFLTSGQWQSLSWSDVARLFSIEAKTDTPFSQNYQSIAERERETTERARLDEAARIGREEARAEAAQRKAEKAAAAAAKKGK